MYVAELLDASERNDLRARCRMLTLPRREPLMEYLLRDTAGRAIGKVVAPPGGLRTGPGAETVLLIRCPPAPCREAVPSAA
jgi:hypothetical protein